MGFRMPRVANIKTADIPKGHFVVYVGVLDRARRNDLWFQYHICTNLLVQNLLSQAEEEFGYHHPMGGITIPCSQDTFLDVTSRLSV
ncbi:putative small auxin-up RNA [Rosa chinensis]|uniref:Putative small auxin-up RNA n=1 Tax=Rosa chinensis TaxID=74649 RepID=A0A2P6PA99_ROSCH|nr:putative small auxin-up RNA [Rosa chinensis]